MSIPTNLKHKPVVVADDYGNIDGRKCYSSDTEGLSLGLAQWNDRGKVDISAKVWRKSGDKWSRQSEELPLHRVLDLAILICRSSQYFRDAYRYPKLYDPASDHIDRVGLQGDAMTVRICAENENIDEDISLFSSVLASDDEMLSERFSVLASLLREMGYGLRKNDIAKGDKTC